MISQRHLIDLGFVPMAFKTTILFSINERCQGVLNNGVFHFKLSKDGDYLQTNNKNQLKWLFRKEHKRGIIELEVIESIANKCEISEKTSTHF